MDALVGTWSPTSDLNASQQRIVATVVLMLLLSTLFYVLRLLVRHRKGSAWKGDDLCAGIALVLSYGPNITIAVAIYYGLGVPEADAGFLNAQKTLILAWVESLFWQLAMPFVKFSLLLLYVRLFPTPEMRRASLIIGIFVLAWMLVTTGVFIFACLPVQYYWDREIPGGHCINYDLFYIITAALNTVTDVIVLLMPLKVVWNLTITRAKKIGLSVVFLTGLFACAASIVRMILLNELDPYNITGSAIDTAIWTCIEVSSGSIAANIPVLAPLFSPIARFFTGRTGSSARKTPGGGYALPQSQRDRMEKYARYGRSGGGSNGGNGRGKRAGALGRLSGFTTIDETVGDPGGKSRGFGERREAEGEREREMEMEIPFGAIGVQSDWDVDSVPAQKELFGGGR